MSELLAIEILESALINFTNAEKMNPAFRDDPLYQLAMEQLKNGIAKYLEEEEETKDWYDAEDNSEPTMSDSERNPSMGTRGIIL